MSAEIRYPELNKKLQLSANLFVSHYYHIGRKYDI